MSTIKMAPGDTLKEEYAARTAVKVRLREERAAKKSTTKPKA